MQTLNKAQDRCLQGMTHHARGHLEACAKFDGSLDADPGCAEAWNNRGAVRHAHGDAAGALADFNHALELKRDYAEAFNNRGIVRHALGDFAAAVADFGEALRIRPHYAEALCNRGTTRCCLLDLDAALADFEGALALHPGDANAYHGRASVRHARGDLDGAVADCEQVLRLVPRQAAALSYHLRAGVRISQRRFAEALEDCNAALEIDPEFCAAYISRGNVRYHLRDLGGHADYRTAFRIDPRFAADEIVRILDRDLDDDPEGVFENCRQHVRICSNDLVAYARRGLTLLLSGREAEAAIDFDQVVRSSPEWKGNLEHLIETATSKRTP
jgi:tetratricopeptide (TPR) repeat protein